MRCRCRRRSPRFPGLRSPPLSPTARRRGPDGAVRAHLLPPGRGRTGARAGPGGGRGAARPRLSRAGSVAGRTGRSSRTGPAACRGHCRSPERSSAGAERAVPRATAPGALGALPRGRTGGPARYRQHRDTRGSVVPVAPFIGYKYRTQPGRTGAWGTRSRNGCALPGGWKGPGGSGNLHGHRARPEPRLSSAPHGPHVPAIITRAAPPQGR